MNCDEASVFVRSNDEHDSGAMVAGQITAKDS
jgi:hypothetical protein